MRIHKTMSIAERRENFLRLAYDFAVVVRAMPFKRVYLVTHYSDANGNPAAEVRHEIGAEVTVNLQGSTEEREVAEKALRVESIAATIAAAVWHAPLGSFPAPWDASQSIQVSDFSLEMDEGKLRG